jgi:Rrf2 family cysteine metabolism transcriptional repressor
MRLSTKTRYGARAMLELALHYDERVVSTAEIAEQQRVSRKYLEHLLVALRSAALVRSVRGAQGGHTLARHPAQISLREIYDALEGPEGFVPCVTCPEICDSAQICATREIWSQMFASCMEILDSTSLEDLTRRANQKRCDGDGMYFI